MKKIILLSGKARSGKDTSATIFKQLDPTIRHVAFASAIKNIIASTFDISMSQLEDWKNDGFVCLHGIPQQNIEDEDFVMQSYRNILQRFGTEAMKPIFGDDIWAELASKTIRHYFQFTETVVITDWRFLSESDYLEDSFKDEAMVFKIRITRDGLESTGSHSSEIELDDVNFDYVIPNNGSIDDLKNQLQKVLNEL